MSVLINQARAAEKAGRWSDAEKLYRAAMTAAPKDPKVLTEAVRFGLRAPGGLVSALPPLRLLLGVAPKSDLAHRLAAQVFYTMGDFDQGLDHAKTAVALAPKEPEAQYVLAYILERQGHAEAALAAAQAALDLNPTHQHALQTKASVLNSLGRLDEAATVCHALHRAYPDDLGVFQVYAQTGKLMPDDPLVQDLIQRIVPLARKIGGHRAVVALRALAKVHLDQGAHAAAFDAHSQAKLADPLTPNYPAYRTFVDNQCAGISRADFFGWQGSADARPVFIIGMPRSGSTLLEQILSGHPQIGGIGESVLMSQIALSAHIPNRDGARMASAVRAATPDQARHLAGIYSAALDQMQPGKARVVDKFLHNFERLALIARLFPKAHILHAMRDPMDNCVSCYMANLSKWHDYTQNLTSMGQFYRDHIRLMDHWKKVLPNPILEVKYESVVADTEGQARRIIDFLGLEWDPNCLKFQETENKARTLSAWQVRQPIYTTSVKRWKRYDAYLDPLKHELKGFYPDGF